MKRHSVAIPIITSLATIVGVGIIAYSFVKEALTEDGKPHGSRKKPRADKRSVFKPRSAAATFFKPNKGRSHFCEHNASDIIINTQAAHTVYHEAKNIQTPQLEVQKQEEQNEPEVVRFTLNYPFDFSKTVEDAAESPIESPVIEETLSDEESHAKRIIEELLKSTELEHLAMMAERESAREEIKEELGGLDKEIKEEIKEAVGELDAEGLDREIIEEIKEDAGENTEESINESVCNSISDSINESVNTDIEPEIKQNEQNETEQNEQKEKNEIEQYEIEQKDAYKDEKSEFMEAKPQDAQSQPEAKELQIPDFSVEKTDGGSVKLSDCLGRPLVLSFWASWCEPCIAQLSDFNKVYNELNGRVTFMMVNLTDGVRETRETALKYLKDNACQFPAYFDTNRRAAHAYRVSSLPTTFFINSKGEIVTYAQGSIYEETLKMGIGMVTEEAKATQSTKAEYRRISVETAKKMMENDKNCRILDVRTEIEHQKGYIEGSMLIPVMQIASRAQIELPNKEQTILVYCRSGRRSEDAARRLVELGYTNVYDFGGILDWNYEIVS